MNKTFSTSVFKTAVLSICLLSTNKGLSQDVQNDTVMFMRQKTAYSQGIVEGLVLERYDLVITNAAKMLDMSHTNRWMMVQSKKSAYAEKTKDFQTNVSTLIIAAQSQNTTNLLTAYARVTENCVNCHQTFRADQYIRMRTKQSQ